MTHREQVINALNHKEAAAVPFHADFTEQSYEKVVKATGDSNFRDNLSQYICSASYSAWPQLIPGKPEHFRDEFGVVWNREGADKDIGVVDNPQIPDIEESAYTFPQPNLSRLRGDIEHMLAGKGDRFTTVSFGYVMYERSWSLMGMENVLACMITNPDELEVLYDQICDFMLKLVDVALEYDEVDAIYFGDDWGQQKGLIMGPAHWRRFIKPRMAKLYGRVKAKGKYVIQHSCGDCWELFPDLVEIGLDCYQTFQPEVYDIHEFKRLYGDKLSVWGGVSTQRCLPYVTPDELRAEVIRLIKVLGKGGGLIIAPTHALPFDVPVDNILAMTDVFQNQDKYL